MKHSISTLMVVVTLVTSSVLLASPDYGGKRFGDCQKTERHMGKDSSYFVERMAKKLDLSQEQNTAVQAIVDQARPQMQQIKEKMLDNRQQLQTLIAQDSLDETKLRQLAEQQGNYKAEMIVIRGKMRNEISKQLNETQHQQFREMRERRKHKRY